MEKSLATPSESEESKALLTSKDVEIERLNKNHTEATRELTSLIAYLEAKVPSQPQDKEVAPISAEQVELSSKLAEAHARIEELLANVRSAEATAAEMTERFAEKEKETEQLKDEVQKVVSKVVEATVRADELAQNFRSQLEAAESSAAAKDAELSDLRAHFESLNVDGGEKIPSGDNDEYLAKVQELEAKLQDALRQADEVSLAKVSMELELTKEREELESLRDQVAYKEEGAKSELEAVQSSFREEIAALQESVSEKEVEMEAIREHFQKEISGLTLKLQLANELKEMKVLSILLIYSWCLYL